MAQKVIFLLLLLISSVHAAANTPFPAFLRTIPVLNQNGGFKPCVSGEKDTYCLDAQIQHDTLRKSIEQGWQSELIGPGEIQPGTTALGYFGKDSGIYYLIALIWTKSDKSTKVIIYGPQSKLLLQTVDQHVQTEIKIFIRRLVTQASVIALSDTISPTRCTEIKSPPKSYSALFTNSSLKYQKITSCFLRSDDNGVYITLATDTGVRLIYGSDGVQNADALPDIRDVK